MVQALRRVRERKMKTFGDVRKLLLESVDVVELGEEPTIDVCHLVNLLDTVSAMESSGNGEYTFVGRVDQLFVNVLDIIILSKM